MPPLSAVRAFEAAARHQNFTHAAEELGMTQAAVSYQIRQLEDRIGTPLFVRQARQATLTPVGRKLARPVSDALGALGLAFADAIDAHRGVLAITALQSVAHAWLTPRLADFQAANPDIEVRMDASERIIDFAQEPFDIGLRYGDGRWHGLAAHHLFDAQFTPVCTPELRDQLEIKEPADLIRARLLGAVEKTWRQWFNEVGAPEAGAAARSSLTLHMQTMHVQAALRGYGVAMAMPILFPEEFESGRLVQLFDHVLVEDSKYWLVYPRERARERKVRLFRDWIVAEGKRSQDAINECFATRRALAKPMTSQACAGE